MFSALPPQKTFKIFFLLLQSKEEKKTYFRVRKYSADFPLLWGDFPRWYPTSYLKGFLHSFRETFCLNSHFLALN